MGVRCLEALPQIVLAPELLTLKINLKSVQVAWIQVNQAKRNHTYTRINNMMLANWPLHKEALIF